LHGAAHLPQEADRLSRAIASDPAWAQQEIVVEFAHGQADGAATPENTGKGLGTASRAQVAMAQKPQSNQPLAARPTARLLSGHPR
jgi:hypothetical protein